MFDLLKSGLNKIRKAFAKTRSDLGEKIRIIFSKPLDEETLDELEQILFEADLGTTLALEFVEMIRKYARKNPSSSTDDLIQAMKTYALEILKKPPSVQSKASMKSPHVILIVGVNGSGKTTSVAKLAKIYQNEGKKVLLAAGDTFRAAAIEQLSTWSERLKIDCVKGQPNSDPSSIIYDALTAALARNADIVIADTAGRLQSKTDLMHELAKIKRVS